MDINEVRSSTNRRSRSKSRKKRGHDESSSDDSDTDSSKSDEDSDSDSGTDSDASTASSVNSDDIDLRAVSIKQRSSTRNVPSAPSKPVDLLSTQDTAVVFRAINRVSSCVRTGHPITSCGNRCPVWQLCEESGAVNPNDCDYMTGWLRNLQGGWSKEVMDEREALNGMGNPVEDVYVNEGTNGHAERVYSEIDGLQPIGSSLG